jgi:hypothetical protein
MPSRRLFLIRTASSPPIGAIAITVFVVKVALKIERLGAKLPGRDLGT